jgi:hypothetical protein
MSSSCRKVASSALLLSLSAAPAAWAQQTYFIPMVETSAEWNSNRELTANPDQKDASSAYKLTGEGRWGMRSPLSQIELRPRLTYQEFPDRDGIDPVEAAVDLTGNHRTQRAEYGLFTRYERQDTYNAEYGRAAFDEADPNNPEASDTGIVLTGETRTRLRFEPSITFNISERTLIGSRYAFDTRDYGQNRLGSLVGYDNHYIDLSLIRQLGPTTQVSVGPYLEHYENELDGEADGYGGAVGVAHEWSELSNIGVLLRFEQSDSKDRDPVTNAEIEGSTSNWGLEITGRRRNQLGGWRYSVGRFIEPSGLGSRLQTDVIRLQYDRPLSPRLALFGAVRFTRDRELGEEDVNLDLDDSRDRDRAYGEVQLRGAVTPEWYVAGGYRYAMLDNQSVFGKGENHTVFLSFGFQGLRPPSR